MVVTSQPSARPASIKQELTDTPSTMTVQVPQSPTSQPSFAPVRPRCSRSIFSSVVSGGTLADLDSPLTVSSTNMSSILR